MPLSPTKTIPSTSLRDLGTQAACITRAALFYEAGMDGDDPTMPGRGATSLFSAAADQCRELCQRCPAFAECLTTATLGLPVDGFVAGTTPEQRTQLQAILGVETRDVSIDRLAGTADLPGASKGDRSTPVDYERLAREIRRGPDASNAEIGRRVGCDAHTVARARHKLAAQPEPQPKPTFEAVRDAYLTVVG